MSDAGNGAATGGAGEGAAGAGANTGADWTTGLADDMKSFVATKGFKTPGDVLESYRNFEKLQGVPQDRLLKLPEDLGSDEGRKVFERLGMPATKDGYSVNLPENFDKDFAEWLRDAAHSNSFTQRQLEGFVQAYAEREQKMSQAKAEQEQMDLSQAQLNLKKEWGAAFEQNQEIADRGAMAFGFGEDEIKALGAALGADKAMQLLYKLGAGSGEHEFVSGQTAGARAFTPDVAKGRIRDLMQDKGFIQRMTAGDAEAKKQWDSLHKMAYPGNMSL